MLCAGRGLARKLRQRAGQRRWRQREQLGEPARDRVAGVEAVVDPRGDLRLVAVEPGKQREPERQVQAHDVRRVAQTRGDEGRQAACDQCIEGAAHPTRGREDGVAFLEAAGDLEPRQHRARERRRAIDDGAVGRRRRSLDRIEAPRREAQIARDCDRTDRIAGGQRAAGIDPGRGQGAGAADQGPGIDVEPTRRGDRAVDEQRAGIQRRGAGIGVRTRQGQRPAADLEQRAARAARCAAVGDDAAHLGREVVAAHGERLRAEEEGARALDRAGGHSAGGQARYVDHAARIVDEAS